MHLTPPDELTGLDRRLRSLARTKPDSRGTRRGDDALRFHHVLVRDVAYAAITKERRADLHERHGAWLERANEPDELVGYHAEQAHRYRSELATGRPGGSGGSRRGQASALQRPESAHGSEPTRLRRSTCSAARPRSSRPTTRSACELLCELGVAQKRFGRFRARRDDARRGGRGSLGRARPALGAPRADRARPPASLQRSRGRAGRAARARRRKRFRSSRSWATSGHSGAPGVTSATYARSKARIGDWQEAVERAARSLPPLRVVGIGLPRGRSLPPSFTGPLPSRRRSIAARSFSTKRPTGPGRRTCWRSWAGSRRSTVGSTSLGATSPRPRRPTRRSARSTLLRTTAAASSGGSRCSPATLRRRSRRCTRCCETFERMHDAAGLSTVAAELGDALYAQGRYDEAKAGSMSRRSAPRRMMSALSGPGDGPAQSCSPAPETFERRSDRRRGSADRRARPMRSATTAPSCSTSQRYCAWPNAPPRQHAGVDEEGLLLFERKGNRVSAEAARVLLSELTVA